VAFGFVFRSFASASFTAVIHSVICNRTLKTDLLPLRIKDIP
jgi:hypothetical protein